jgi:hypothetical protein
MPRREDEPNPQELRREASQIEKEEKGTEQGKNPGNVAGDKKAAAMRKEHGSRRGSRDEE